MSLEEPRTHALVLCFTHTWEKKRRARSINRNGDENVAKIIFAVYQQFYYYSKSF